MGRAGCGSPCAKKVIASAVTACAGPCAGGACALQPKAFMPRTTDSTHGLRCAPKRRLNKPKPTHANRVWVSDITYLPLANGEWAYLCAFQDVAS